MGLCSSYVYPKATCNKTNCTVVIKILLEYISLDVLYSISPHNEAFYILNCCQATKQHSTAHISHLQYKDQKECKRLSYP